MPTRILVLAPDGLDGVPVVAASCRASALGFLNHASGEPADASPFEKLEKLISSPYGMRISPSGLIRSRDLWSRADRLGVLFIPVGSGEEGGQGFEAAIRLAIEMGRLVLAEVTSRVELRRAIAGGVAGLIVSGHEAGGLCGSDSSFVLLQAALAEGGLPVWVRGGVGERVAAGAVAAGAAGVVLDGALLLARESPIGATWRERIERCDGSETTGVMPATGPGVRVFAIPGSPASARLRASAEAGGPAWESAVAREVGWGEEQCPPVGQDAAFAARLARKYLTVGGIVQALERAIGEGIAAARAARPLAEGSPLAAELGTRYPILQGPMTRVSDVAPFAEAVARDGGLPFVALAMLRGAEVRALLSETADRLAGRPWGVGILGFVSPEVRAEQLAAVADLRPPWALIAGGRPDQAAGLERQGIRTYLHVPSPGLLDRYLRDGCRRFVLEGRECGGHVGPRSSFVLWEQAASVIAEAIDRGAPAGEISLVFAGGIHDARSAALVAGLAGPLARRGVKVGALVGTGYLFTREAVDTGAIVRRFQEEALRCRETVLLESGPGHQVRVSPSPFVARFTEERRRLIAEGRPADEIREALEALNVGRLRVAAKGVDRDAGAHSPLSPVDEDYQRTHGLYMLGQAAALRDATTTIAQLHREIAEDSSVYLDRAIPGVDREAGEESDETKPSDIAIIGMSAVFPGAGDLARFWSNTLRGVDAICEVPPDRWDWRLYYDPDPKAPDKIVSKWGGFLPDVAFDPLRFGMPPSSLPSIEPAQLLALEVVRGALADAGYAERPFARDRTAVVLGMGGGAAQLAMGYAFRSYLPMLDTVIPGGGRAALEACRGQLPEWTEDSFPGFLLNVTAGRIANRLNLGGANYTVDAACGSSLAAANLAVRELETGAADVVILGGVDTVQNPFTYLAFSKTQAFSPRGRCRPFDAGADGIVISEGVAAVVLKRLADAERDGDRIYAVIKGLGASSDGRARGLTAPVVEGQVRAIERAYAKAGVSPTTVGYVEAHGTGTALGDVVEVESLGQVFRAAGAGVRDCIVGSVKSLIGHTKCAAGLAGLINASLALHHKVLPPTIGIESPNPKLDLHDGPFRLCTEAEPWLHPDDGRPRRAGVSAFGFGGTNFHAVLEEYDRNTTPAPVSGFPDWPEELLVFSADESAGVVASIDRLIRPLESGARPALRELAHTLIEAGRSGATPGATLVIVTGSHEDLLEKLRLARRELTAGRRELEDPRGVYYAAQPAWSGAPVAFLFPGQGAQSPGMLRELAVAFPEVRGAFEEFDRAVRAGGGTAPGPLVFPPPAFDDAARVEAGRALARTDVAQPAVGAACVGMLRLLRSLGLEPDMIAGHSYGELVALHAAGAIEARELAVLSSARGQLMIEAGRGAAGAMAAILAGPEDVERLIRDVPGMQAANWNGPRQTVVAGPTEAVDRILELSSARGLPARRLAVSSAFHTPMVAGAREPFSRLAAERLRMAPDRPVYSNLDASHYPAERPAIAARLGDHLASPVRFADMIDAMYGDGARVFIEAGPGAILTPLVESILEDRPHLAVACDATTAPGLSAFLRRLARLVVAGLPIRLERLTAGRAHRRLDLDRLPPGDLTEPPSASTWMVNGSRARPLAAPEPARLGTGPVLPVPLSGTNLAKAAAGSAVERSHPGDNGRSSTPKGGSSAAPTAAAMLHRTPVPAGLNGKLESPMMPEHPAAQAPASPPAPPSARATGDAVLESFQKTMQVFLEVQKATMLAYLSGRGDSASGAPFAATAKAPAVGTAQPGGFSGGHSEAQVGDAAAFESRLRDALHHQGGNGHATKSGSFGSRIVAPEPTTAGRLASGAHEPSAQPSSGGNGTPGLAGRDVDRLGAPDRATITARLLEVVRDRTGYPLETLDLDLDIEADLGIDSIKRVEILGKLRDEFPMLNATADSSEVMDALARARTLGAIVDRMVVLAEPIDRSAPSPIDRPRGDGSSIPDSPLPDSARQDHRHDPAAAPPTGEPRHTGTSLWNPEFANPEFPESAQSPAAGVWSGPVPGRVERRVLEAVESPLPRRRCELMAGGRVVVTDDGRRRRAIAMAGVGGCPGGSARRARSAGRMDVPLGGRRGGGRAAVAGADRRHRARHAARPADLGRSLPGALGASDRRGGQGPVLAGEVHGPRPGGGRGGGRGLPDRRDRTGRPIRPGRRSSGGIVLPRAWRDRRAGQDARPRMGRGPLPRRGPGASRTGRGARPPPGG